MVKTLENISTPRALRGWIDNWEESKRCERRRRKKNRKKNSFLFLLLLNGQRTSTERVLLTENSKPQIQTD